MDEGKLMEQIAGGDEAALHGLLRQYGPLIRYILRPILPDERDQEECYADISLKLWQTAGSFDGEKGTLRSSIRPCSSWFTSRMELISISR